MINLSEAEARQLFQAMNDPSAGTRRLADARRTKAPELLAAQEQEDPGDDTPTFVEAFTELINDDSTWDPV